MKDCGKKKKKKKKEPMWKILEPIKKKKEPMWKILEPMFSKKKNKLFFFLQNENFNQTSFDKFINIFIPLIFLF